MVRRKTDKTPAEIRRGDVVRTGEGLRDALFDEIDGLRKGTVSATRAGATARLACQIISSVRVEIDFHRFVRLAGGGEKSTTQRVETLYLGKS